MRKISLSKKEKVTLAWRRNHTEKYRKPAYYKQERKMKKEVFEKLKLLKQRQIRVWEEQRWIRAEKIIRE